MSVHLLDVDVFGHGELRGHQVFVRGRFPNRVWKCARHDCDFIHIEGLARAALAVPEGETK